MLDSEISKNIIFSPWGHEDIQNDVAQPIWMPKHSKCLISQNDQNAPSQPRVDRRSKPLQNNTFHSFKSKPRFSKNFGNFDQVDSEFTLAGPKTLILIRPLEQVETNDIVKIIKFSVQRLFMGQNRN